MPALIYLQAIINTKTATTTTKAGQQTILHFCLITHEQQRRRKGGGRGGIERGLGFTKTQFAGWRCHFDFGLAKKWAVDGPLNLPCHPLLLCLSSITSLHPRPCQIFAQSPKLPVYPFATQSSALLICSAKREKVREERNQGRGKQIDGRGGRGKGPANAA